ncbi:zinc ion binding / nucleic acid binding protein [Thalictrum thalictroides]|uniref:Zinc ion binding / nucleic acid binding protein n=1 Tax=Thalictrum thalictroides TaxID=46969 RepID=A0A7J6VEZ6_THATH|nr:zinc ion binding / nucleic acid binding protein [Thalictrum thalictroides]
MMESIPTVPPSFHHPSSPPPLPLPFSSIHLPTPSTENPWSDLFSTKKSGSFLNSKLKKFLPIYQDGIAVVPQNIISKGIQQWEDLLVGYFIEKKLPFSIVKNTLTNFWKLKGSFSISSDQDLFYFKFNSLEDKKKVLDEGPIFIGGRFFVIRQWSKEIEKQKNKLKSVPVWARIFNLPKELWTEEGLGYVASLIGEPICADEASMRQQRLSFAKVCVEVTTLHKFDKSIKLNMGGDEVITLGIDYPWIPSICSICNSFGHKTSKCAKAKSAVWVPKNVEHYKGPGPSVDRGQTSCNRDENGSPIIQKEGSHQTNHVSWSTPIHRGVVSPVSGSSPKQLGSTVSKPPSPNRFEVLAVIEEVEEGEINETLDMEEGEVDAVTTIPGHVESDEDAINVSLVNLGSPSKLFLIDGSHSGTQSSVDVSHVSLSNYSGDNEETSQYTQEKAEYEEASSEEDFEDSDPIEEPVFFRDHLEPASLSVTLAQPLTKKASRAEKRKQIQDDLQAELQLYKSSEKFSPSKQKLKGRKEKKQKDRPKGSGKKSSKSYNV